MPNLEPDRLSRLVDVAATADWRWKKAEQFPEDQRNREAAELLEKLLPEIASLNGSPLHLRLETFIDEEAFDLEIDGTLRSIGFGYFPQSGEKLLQGIVANLEQQCVSRPHLRAV
jgi:hypothetical protein